MVKQTGDPAVLAQLNKVSPLFQMRIRPDGAGPLYKTAFRIRI